MLIPRRSVAKETFFAESRDIAGVVLKPPKRLVGCGNGMAKTGASAMKSMRFNQYIIPIQWDCPGESHRAGARGLATYYPLNLAESWKRQPVPIWDASVSKMGRPMEKFAIGSYGITKNDGQFFRAAGEMKGKL
jgi:hypothetical protein